MHFTVVMTIQPGKGKLDGNETQREGSRVREEDGGGSGGKKRVVGTL